jgi:hypothetical protein
MLSTAFFINNNNYPVFIEQILNEIKLTEIRKKIIKDIKKEQQEEENDDDYYNKKIINNIDF